MALAQAVVLSRDTKHGRMTLSTKKLELIPGEFLTDKATVFEHAEEAAANVRKRMQGRSAAAES